MNFPRFAPPRIVSLAAPLVLAAVVVAQSLSSAGSATPAAAGQKASGPTAQATLDLPRLTTRGKAGEPRPVSRSKVTVDALSPQGATGARVMTKQDLVFLGIEAGQEWSRPLRGSAKDTIFVSFLAYGSIGTVIDIGGARLVVEPGNKPGYALIRVGSAAASTGAFSELIKVEQHDSAPLAALPVLTVRLDPVANVWDLFVFQRLVADGIPLNELKGARQFSLQAGAQGAWILNLTTAAENPLFVDANSNGIEDGFERTQRKGSLLAADAPAMERRALIAEWRLNSLSHRVAPWKIRRPVPGVVTAR